MLIHKSNMDIWLNQKEADALNKMNESIHGDSAHCLHRYVSGEEVPLTELMASTLDASYKERSQSILHCPEQEHLCVKSKRKS